LQAALEAAHFDTDKALPLPRGSRSSARRHPAAAGARRVLMVVGHADAVGGAAHNLELSADRAQAGPRRTSAMTRTPGLRFYDHPTGRRAGVRAKIS